MRKNRNNNHNKSENIKTRVQSHAPALAIFVTAVFLIGMIDPNAILRNGPIIGRVMSVEWIIGAGIVAGLTSILVFLVGKEMALIGSIAMAINSRKFSEENPTENLTENPAGNSEALNSYSRNNQTSGAAGDPVGDFVSRNMSNTMLILRGNSYMKVAKMHRKSAFVTVVAALAAVWFSSAFPERESGGEFLFSLGDTVMFIGGIMIMMLTFRSALMIAAGAVGIERIKESIDKADP